MAIVPFDKSFVLNALEKVYASPMS